MTRGEAAKARTIPRLLVACALVLAAGSLSQPASVLAECVPLSPWPSFTDAAPTARRIVLGTVTETPGDLIASRFTLRVDEVPRGDAPATLRFDGFQSGAALTTCPNDTALVVHRGDRIALAYGSRLEGVPGRITAVAFVAPSKPDRALMPKMEQVTLAEVRRLTELPPTDAITEQAPVGPDTPSEAAVTLLASILGALWFMRRTAVVAGSRKRPGTSGVP